VIETEIQFEVWLPLQEWNGNLQVVGNGGVTGDFNYPSMAAAIARGYATATSDLGHRAASFQDASWAPGHPERVANYADRAHHLLAQQAKKVASAFYGRAPKFSYFNGCSVGGWQALTEAQRYPGDYDGIISGAPLNYFTHRQAHEIHIAQARARNPAGVIPANKMTLLTSGAIAACDAADGVNDGLISDPLACHFDPAALQCAGEDSPSCLTAAQVTMARMLLSPLRSASGKEIYPGMAPGTPISAAAPTSQHADPSQNNWLQAMIPHETAWTTLTFDLDRDLPRIDAEVGPLLNSMNPDLRPFQTRGGKLILYHGWADNQLTPYNTINYYDSVVDLLGARSTNAFARLFLAPGMSHCSGGAGPNTFDVVGALEQWVERGKAPDRIVAAHSANGKVDRTRPLCPYPQVARYKGTGSSDDAESFSCVDPAGQGGR